jgi:hypothetical protein
MKTYSLNKLKKELAHGTDGAFEDFFSIHKNSESEVFSITTDISGQEVAVATFKEIENAEDSIVILSRDI